MSTIEQSVLTSDNFTLPYTIIKATTQPPKGIIVYYHGGGLVFGKPNDLPQDYLDILTQHYDVILASYRLAPEATIDQIIDDALTCFDAIKENYQDVPTFVFGRSSGAYLSMIVARDRQVDGIIDFYGYSRLQVPAFLRPSAYFEKLAGSITPEMIQTLTSQTPVVADQLQQRFLLYVYARGKANWFDMLSLEQTASMKYNISPKQLKSFPPMFIVHCKGDTDVPFSESEHIIKHVPSTSFTPLDKDAHDFDRKVDDFNKDIYQQAVNFIDNVNSN
ncbi:alpha/beta hydrolase [Staphylococcus simiae]|uniref:alpha/beta hydrolase n=1 Tax=Staphylococcus simiae TaxID=308354 RepID=UPI001A95DA71|nr:alpha/beta hydrolase [Staphylococcus simiae]MBO1198744.1 alpha/beta hydrolase [Staphylococcus simiae]MBO1200996.1 alpha/beta hydrolase [Staphylococcus simiae]MBO1203159.1 alpha/beta hydrolase [Staphylococcus simiae]MBO1210733.1 alpha/beta hydrolase [Staphylococcus simiae]MBO1229334.1 alpha/beta hydrolase [Staphylococcus simiae]